MIAKVMTEGTMEDSYIFSIFNENKELTRKMLAYIKSAAQIDEDFIAEQLMQIQKSRISPLAEEVLGAYARGEIELLYSKSVKVPVSTPFVVRKDPSFKGNIYGIKATIFISNFGSITKNQNMLDIPMKNLYILMESAYIALYIHTHPNTLERNIGLMRIVSSVYMEMFMRILNKEFALSLDTELYGRVAFVIGKFFLDVVWGATNPDIAFNVVVSNVKNANKVDLAQVNEMYKDAEIKDISGALLFIKSLSPRLDSLSVKYIIQRYMLTYHGGAVMAIDYLPYMFYVIINTVLGGFLISQTTLSDIIKNEKDIKSFYPELTKIML